MIEMKTFWALPAILISAVVIAAAIAWRRSERRDDSSQADADVVTWENEGGAGPRTTTGPDEKTLTMVMRHRALSRVEVGSATRAVPNSAASSGSSASVTRLSSAVEPVTLPGSTRDTAR